MSNRHFLYYIVALVVFLFSYMGYRLYKDSVDLKIMKAEISQRSLDKDGQSTTPPIGSIGDIVVKERLISKKPVQVRYGSPFSDVNNNNIVTEPPGNIVTGPPGKTWYADELVTQLVETPDGKIHKFLLPPGEEYQIKPGTFIPDDWKGPAMMMVEIDGVMYDVPEGESMNSYIDKIRLSSIYDVPLDSVDRLIEADVIPSSPIEAQYDPLLAPRGGNSVAEIEGFGDTDTVSEGGIPVDTEGTLSPSDVPDMVKPTPPPQSVADIENQLTPEGIEAELSEGLSPERFDKAQQLIDEYGLEEGLRRLREMDPEEARRFESDKSRLERRRRNPPARDTSDDAVSTQ